VVIDKVVVHRTQSTLVVIAVGMSLFAIFSALLSWVRQYLVLHTGNRVDAVLGAAVFEHLLKLPTRYFETRPTGVITARLRGVENIREFIASAAVTLVLDLPFLGVFVAIMLAYSVALTVLALSIIALKRVGDEALEDTLAVVYHHDGHLSEACEFRMTPVDGEAPGAHAR
jgi:ATP-binding cassette, subfamily B, bacterial HlyB/CyaB